MTKLIGVNEKGIRVGESHPKARLTDHDVDLIFVLYEDGVTIVEIARKMECRKSVINDILKGRRRAQRPVRWKRIGTHNELS